MMSLSASWKLMVSLALASVILRCDARRVRAGQAGRSILLEVEDQLGREAREFVELKATRLEETLRHTFFALPRNARGAVGAPAARYALHRLFVQLHGWQMHGLVLTGDEWHHGSPMDAFGSTLPTPLHSSFCKRLDMHGLDLRELSVVGALLERMVHHKVEQKLNLTFQALDFDHEATLTKDQAIEAMHTFLAHYIISRSLVDVRQQTTIAHLVQQKKLIETGEYYQRWDAVKALVLIKVNEHVPNDISFDFEKILLVLEAVCDDVFELENTECSRMREDLVSMEDRPGTVLLADFYRPALTQCSIPPCSVPYTESESYLDKAGALDVRGLEAGKEKRVLIANYLLADSNCLSTTSSYAVCCIDLCEELMDDLEKKIAAPTASPEELLSAINVSAMHDKMKSGHQVVPHLTELLDQIAEYSHGQVPLHGRLFAQWLHHAYPRICPYPFEADKKIVKRYHEPVHEASLQDLKKHVEQQRVFEEDAASRSSQHDVEHPMWTHKEELVDPKAHKAKQHPKLSSSWITALMILFTLVGAAVTLEKISSISGRNVCKVD
eukprot:TRINITY_DN33872_c0_g1_i1.p1 TRINITY_DN33872_c0_g1~~TRINITY_DN33872_c0_g1_i1.p1  ORF type:complete len:555 (+),score=97.69 TRINITY_DN33872_c0_g1_i1:79-1743(+)